MPPGGRPSTLPMGPGQAAQGDSSPQITAALSDIF